jgi:predicted MFS family arabinose efflux permease
MNLGGITGSLISGLVAAMNSTLIFSLAGSLFLVLIAVAYAGLRNIEAKPSSKVEIKSPVSVNWGQMSFVVLLTILFWAFYNQFNVYVPLFVKDSVNDEKWIGYSFAIVSAFVVLTSAGISKLTSPVKSLKILMPIAACVLAAAWVFMGLNKSIPSIALFCVIFAVVDAVWVTRLTSMWTALNPEKIKFIQSLNFAIRNIGMAVGTYAGGLFYGNHVGSLSSWIVFSAGLCVSGAVLSLINRK